MQIYVRHRGKFVMLALWSGFACIATFWLTIRRSGFGTTYSRCGYLVMWGEYKQLLEPGAFPANDFLPPHLRLDQRSYLDLPETEVAVPPIIDVSVAEREQVRNLEHAIPAAQRSDLHIQFGPLRSQTIVMTGGANERYVRRRLGISPQDRDRLQAEGDNA
ncbi:uncharacterized protein Tco025E_04532 [Trypanosoma conorhini]|uniref:Uncharacterized protein n=1 Tax=Trypanosoma conorhini TaxID=83891 RepID=A0A422PLY1_9TRYP|nr:uncharacterized protein Tco025E_04532 [Trypanosoma conorhini]RNF18724.1 hypothetical protein Tco025E_04532 [Trypanosoma conorhini]